MMIHANATLDARGLDCPIPFFRTTKALSELDSGQTLKILTNECEVTRYLPLFCQKKGHELLDKDFVDGEYTYYIKKG